MSLSLALWGPGKVSRPRLSGPPWSLLFIQTGSLGPGGQRPLTHLSLAPGQAGEWQLGSLMPTSLPLLQMETEAQDGGGGGVTYSRSQPQWWWKAPGVVGGSDQGDVAWAWEWAGSPQVWVFPQKVPAIGEARSLVP